MKLIDDETTILAVPFDQILFLSQEQGERICELIKNKPTASREEREKKAHYVKSLLGKPSVKALRGYRIP